MIGLLFVGFNLLLAKIQILPCKQIEQVLLLFFFKKYLVYESI